MTRASHWRDQYCDVASYREVTVKKRFDDSFSYKQAAYVSYSQLISQFIKGIPVVCLGDSSWKSHFTVHMASRFASALMATSDVASPELTLFLLINEGPL